MSLVPQPNSQILLVLDQLRRLRLKEKEKYSAAAYARAIAELKKYPEIITSGAQVSHLPHIGKGTVEKIDQILQTGTVDEFRGPMAVAIPPLEVAQPKKGRGRPKKEIVPPGLPVSGNLPPGFPGVTNLTVPTGIPSTILASPVILPPISPIIPPALISPKVPTVTPKVPFGVIPYIAPEILIASIPSVSTYQPPISPAPPISPVPPISPAISIPSISLTPPTISIPPVPQTPQVSPTISIPPFPQVPPIPQVPPTIPPTQLDNSKIINMLEQMRRLRNAAGEKWKVLAYERAINNIRRYPYLIQTGAQAQSIPGIDKGIADKIEELLTTGQVSELVSQVNPLILPIVSTPQVSLSPESFAEKQKVLQLFETIQGVGTTVSERWYDAGYRTVESIPLSILTNEQRIGIAYRTEFLQRIPREQIDHFNTVLDHCLTPKGIFFKISGSYSRGRTTSGDVDVIVIDQPGRNIFEEIKSCGFLTDIVKQGAKKMAAVTIMGGIHRKVDFELVQSTEYPFALLYFTGPGHFNELMREHAKKNGLNLNEKGLTDKSTGQVYQASSEEEIFKMLGLVYLTPQERDRYDQK